jgi:hypothetical protein
MELAEKQAPKDGALKERPRSPLSGAPLPIGRQKGVQNKLTRSLKEAVEMAARDCHPRGLAGWLVERANGSVQDRQIFATLVGKVIPIQVNQQVQGGISINLGWLAGRQIGTSAAQAEVIDAQPVIAIEHSPSSHWTTNANWEQGQQLKAIERATSDAEPAVLRSPKRDGADDPGAI